MAKKVLPTVSLISRRTPLAVKAVLVVLVAGLVLWAVTDYSQNRYLKGLLETHYKNMIRQVAVEQRINFDNSVKKYFQSVKLFTVHKRFGDYLDSLEEKGWTGDENTVIKYHKQPPGWFPARSTIRAFIPARFVILLDGKRRVREVYTKGNYKLPGFFLKPDTVLYQISQNQSFLTTYNGIPYILASKRVAGPGGELRCILTLASPIDEHFIAHSNNITASRKLVALVTGINPYIIASNDKKRLPAGASLSALKEYFFIEEEGFFDYGNSDLLVSLATFFPKEDIEKFYADTLNKERAHRTVTTLIFIIMSALIVYWIAYHIQKVSKRITEFSHMTLGTEAVELPKGDQIHVLKERFRQLTEEIITSREIIKKQAEEQTRLIVNNAFNAIITTDDNGRILSWNPRAETIFGWSGNEASGEKLYDMIVPEVLHNQCRGTIKSIMAAEKQPVSKERIEITCRNREGHEFPADFSVSSVMSGNSYIFIFIIRDITERIEAEKKIKALLRSVTKAKIEWEKTFDSVDELILLVDSDLRIIRCNRSFAEFAGRSPGEVTGGMCDEYLLCGRERLDEVKGGPAKATPVRTEVMTGDGRWLYVNHMPVFDERKEFLYTIITAIEITELKNIQHTLSESKAELKKRVAELENFYNMAVNRELKMVALKKEIAKLRERNLENVNM